MARVNRGRVETVGVDRVPRLTGGIFRVLGAHKLIHMGLWALIITLLAFPGIVSAGAEAQAVEGQVTVVKSGARDPIPLAANSPVDVGDEVVTDRESKVFIKSLLGDDVNTAMGGGARFLLDQLEVTGGTTVFSARSVRGPIRYYIQTVPGAAYTITTPTALITVPADGEVKDFVVQVFNAAQTAVTVIGGYVVVKNVREDIVGEVQVYACSMTSVAADEPPRPPMGVGRDELLRLIGITTIPGTLPEDAPDCGPGPGPRPWPEPWPDPFPCPCPFGQALDPVDGICKECDFANGAYYDPYFCECRCCPGFFDPVSGLCVDSCTTKMPIPTNGAGTPGTLPAGGCPTCICCEDNPANTGLGCVQHQLDPGHPQCGNVPGCGPCPAGPIIPPLPGAEYPCKLCCKCDGDPGRTAADPCGLDAVGAPPSGICGRGGCIARSECLAIPGAVFHEMTPAGASPCWICDYHQPWAKKLAPNPCSSNQECAKLTNGVRPCCVNGKCKSKPMCKPGSMLVGCECRPLPPPPPCSSNEQCMRESKGMFPCCFGGKCGPRPRCKPGERLLDCKCIPKPPCKSNEQCRMETNGLRPCCVNHECRSNPRCGPGEILEDCRCIPKPPCKSNEQCRKETNGLRPCCVNHECRPNPRCGPGEILEDCRCIKPPCASDHECYAKTDGERPCCRNGDCVPAPRCRPGEILRGCECKPGPECGPHRPCGHNQCCLNGRCIPAPICGRGYKLVNCECVPIDPTICRSDEQCGPNQCCRNGKCIPAPQCGRGYKLVNCECIPYQPETECGPHRPCGHNQCCLNGKCISAPRCRPGYKLVNCECIPDPPETECGPNRPCGRNQCCLNGRCIPAPHCGRGFILRDCRCVPDTPGSTPCTSDSQCGGSTPCCRNGKCGPRPHCPTTAHWAASGRHSGPADPCKCPDEPGDPCEKCRRMGKPCKMVGRIAVCEEKPDGDPCAKCRAQGKPCKMVGSVAVCEGQPEGDPCEKCARMGKQCRRHGSTATCVDAEKPKPDHDPCEKCVRMGKQCRRHGRTATCVDAEKPKPEHDPDPCASCRAQGKSCKMVGRHAVCEDRVKPDRKVHPTTPDRKTQQTVPDRKVRPVIPERNLQHTVPEHRTPTSVRSEGKQTRPTERRQEMFQLPGGKTDSKPGKTQDRY